MKRQRGFTLLEVHIALSIVGLLLTIAFGGLRVAMAAWRQGEDRAEAHLHVRAVAYTLSRALGAAYPYRGTRGLSPEAVVLFAGKDSRLEFVTQAAPLPLQAPVAFTAVYSRHRQFVRRILRRVGVLPANLDDAEQDVFLAVYKNLSRFEARSSVRTWLFRIGVRRRAHHPQQHRSNRYQSTPLLHALPSRTRHHHHVRSGR